jgi:hypothetical protein
MKDLFRNNLGFFELPKGGRFLASLCLGFRTDIPGIQELAESIILCLDIRLNHLDRFQVCLDLSDKDLMVGSFLQRLPHRDEERMALKVIFLVDLNSIKLV